MSDPAVLYGVQDFREPAGMIPADEWVNLRCRKREAGRMAGVKRSVMWFYDPVARDDFMGVYGGISVTLHRKHSPSAAVQAGLEANLAKQFGGK